MPFGTVIRHSYEYVFLCNWLCIRDTITVSKLSSKHQFRNHVSEMAIMNVMQKGTNALSWLLLKRRIVFCCFDMKEALLITRRDSEYTWRQTVQCSDSTEIDFSQLTDLTHWVRDKMVAIFYQTPFSNGFSLMKIYKVRLKCHWSLFLWIHVAIFQHWFRKWLDTK